MSTAASREAPRSGSVDNSRSMWCGGLVGIGVAGFIDEVIFHQLLHWHHFYDRSTPAAGLVSDGLFHALSWFSVVGGLFVLADLRRWGSLSRTHWMSGLFLGLGGFQLYDGTIQHKLMRLHQIRYRVTLWPYDLSWNVLAIIALIVAIVLFRRAEATR
jgi:uncharacterized membrane protein